MQTPDEKPYPDEKAVGLAQRDLNGDDDFPAKALEPFGNEDTAEVKYRTMKWW